MNRVTNRVIFDLDLWLVNSTSQRVISDGDTFIQDMNILAGKAAYRKYARHKFINCNL